VPSIFFAAMNRVFDKTSIYGPILAFKVFLLILAKTQLSGFCFNYPGSQISNFLDF
jgi:hypothetical protein